MSTNRTMPKVGRGLRCAGVAPTGLMVSLGALAQDAANSSSPPNAAQPPEAAANEAPTLSTVIVTGFRKSYADALNIKRDTVEITDSIAEDGLGRFPDLNVGEALARLPGVQI